MEKCLFLPVEGCSIADGERATNSLFGPRISNQERTIARPRDFEIDDVLREALFVFWHKGYEGSSLTDIEDATGVARMSLYNVFGSKEGLFYSALERYIEATKRLYEKYLVANDIAGLEMLIAAYAKSERLGDASKWGCLMLNTITGSDGVSSEAHRMIEEFRTYAIAKIETVLKAACRSGEIANRKFDCHSWAEFILITMWGAKAAIRHAGSIDAALPVVGTLSHILRGLRNEPRNSLSSEHRSAPKRKKKN